MDLKNATPHARGSTPHIPSRRRPNRGFPAHAGIIRREDDLVSVIHVPTESTDESQRDQVQDQSLHDSRRPRVNQLQHRDTQ